MSTTGISFSGLSSGIDTDSIVKRLMELEQIPITRLQRRQTELQSRMSAYTHFRSLLSSLSSAASGLNAPSAYSTLKGSTSNADVATIAGTGDANAVEGSFSLKVYQLAQAHKLGSAAQTDSTSALNLTGEFTVNGKTVSVVASDTLSSIASKVNGAGAGVTASIINGGTGQAYLTFTANDSGLAKSIDLADTTGSVLSSLGMMDTTIRQTVPNGALSHGLSSASTPLSQLLGFVATGPTDVTVNGQTVTIDPSSDTLATLAEKLNGVSGIQAQVVSSQENGRTVHRLQITGEAGTPTFGTEGDVFLDLGILKRANEIVAAQDAMYTLDNVALSSGSNTITNTVPGATITLLQADPAGKSANLTLKRDNDSIKTNIKSFVDAYNAINSFIQTNSKFDSETYESGLLFGDSVTSQVESTLTNLLFGNVSGVSGTYRNLASIGVMFGNSGELKVDDALLDAALATGSSSVAAVLRAIGSTSNPDLTFVSSTSKTLPSGAGGFSVNITQLATKGSITAAAAQTGPSTTNEILTFGGTAFPTSVDLTVPAGSTLEDTINLINNDSRLKEYVVARNNGGRLELQSLRYGTPGNFTVVSDLAASSDNSGIGLADESTFVNGLDVAGTINGEEATGSGQFLTGKSGNALTDGLQIQYTGTVLGDVGTVTLTKGIASQLVDQIESFITGSSALLPATDNSLQSQYDDLSDSITSLKERLAAKEASLRARFTAMESAIAAAQAQAQRLAAMLGTSK